MSFKSALYLFHRFVQLPQKNENKRWLRTSELVVLESAVTNKGKSCKFYVDYNDYLNLDILNGALYRNIQSVQLQRYEDQLVSHILELHMPDDPLYDSGYRFIEFGEVPKSWSDLFTDGIEFLIINEPSKGK